MALTYPTNSGGFERQVVPSGSHIAVCDMVVDLGIQPGSPLYPKARRKVYIRWELPNERIHFEKDGKKQDGPTVIGKHYTGSMNEKSTLRHHLESWRGRQFTDPEANAFDVSAVLGKPCMLTVMQTVKQQKIYADIVGIGPLPRGIAPQTIIPEMTPLVYTPESPQQVYAQLPEWLRKMIDAQIIEEPTQEPDQPPVDAYSDTEIGDDDIPF
jgi:hypothetical protein